MKKPLALAALFYTLACFANDNDSLNDMTDYLSPWATKESQAVLIEKDIKKYRKPSAQNTVLDRLCSCTPCFSFIKYILARERSKFYKALGDAAKKYPTISPDILIEIERSYIGKSIFDNEV
jgi:hypothetical protein